MKVTLELGKATLAQGCWKQHEFESQTVERFGLSDYVVYFCLKCGAKVRIK